MYAIMGITGRIGGAIAENLLEHGAQIRAIVRNPEKRHDGKIAEQRLRLPTSTIRMHWHPLSTERMECFS